MSKTLTLAACILSQLFLSCTGGNEQQGEMNTSATDGWEVYRNEGEGDHYPEPMFAILNYAKITDSPMTGEWVMEVDWVKHESRKK